MMNKKNLKMKPVGSEYMEQYNALLRYVFQVTEHELSSIGERNHPGKVPDHAEGRCYRLVR